MIVAAICITLVCLLGGNWFGPVGAFFNLLTPIPVAYLSMRFGLVAGAVAVAVVSLLLLWLAPVSVLAAYVGLFASGSLLLPALLRRHYPWDRAVLFSVLGTTLVTVALIGAAMLAQDLSLQQFIGELVQSEVDQAMAIYRAAGLSKSQLLELQQVVEQIAEFIRQSFYGLFLAAGLAIQLQSLAVLQRLKKGHYRIEGVAFDRWRLPAGLIWLLIVAGFSLLVPQPAVGLLGRNLLVVLLPLYFLQGLAVVSSFLQRKAYSPLFKGMIYLLVFILNPLPLIVTGVGVFDLWVDFRRPRKKKL